MHQHSQASQDTAHVLTVCVLAGLPATSFMAPEKDRSENHCSGEQDKPFSTLDRSQGSYDLVHLSNTAVLRELSSDKRLAVHCRLALYLL